MQIRDINQNFSQKKLDVHFSEILIY